MAQAQLPQWTVGGISYRELSLALPDGEAAVHWCQRHKLLSDSKMCPKCGTDMRLVKRKGVNPEDMGWRCPKKGCRKEVALRPGTFFEGSHLLISQILSMIHLWSTKTPVGKIMTEVDVSYSLCTKQLMEYMYFSM